jgi:catechol 2,3-dioxygenase-like lactoylglutathione lyase family enzyme
LARGSTAARLPCQDLERARRWYSEKLGLEPTAERPGAYLYEMAAGGEFALFQSAGAASGAHTQMGWSVEDLDAVVADLRARGVEFEQYEIPGVDVTDGIALIPGNYPHKGSSERAVWFHDCEGNLLGIGQPLP